eukprot:TRINITY_DN23217_c0_g1_i1.p1 TRINITY_DN23217_c0_g1~~TRINITY_DN23217_c0_g1_i1.p1  ORF type:complete len:292 (-),score=47.13 TRINITY_DN23217_c0_g1_i1:120-995(-)
MANEVLIRDGAGAEVFKQDLSIIAPLTIKDVRESIGPGFLVMSTGDQVATASFNIPAGAHTWVYQRIRTTVDPGSLCQYVGILIEVDKIGGDIVELNGLVSTTFGLVSVAHGLARIAKAAGDAAKRAVTVAEIRLTHDYFFRDGAGHDHPLQIEKVDVDQDLVKFSEIPPAGVPALPTAAIAPNPPKVMAEVFLVHWPGPELDVKGNFIVEEGKVVAECGASHPGQYLATVNGFSGSCGGGYFFTLDGNVVGLHMGVGHESHDKVRVAELRGQKAHYTYFVGCKELAAFLA